MIISNTTPLINFAEMEAKQQGLILEIAPALLELRSKARFWISDHLEDRILRDAGEK